MVDSKRQPFLDGLNSRKSQLSPFSCILVGGRTKRTERSCAAVIRRLVRAVCMVCHPTGLDQKVSSRREPEELESGEAALSLSPNRKGTRSNHDVLTRECRKHQRTRSRRTRIARPDRRDARISRSSSGFRLAEMRHQRLSRRVRQSNTR